jgi:hypothetical protein
VKTILARMPHREFLVLRRVNSDAVDLPATGRFWSFDENGGCQATGNESQRLEATPELPCEPYVEIGGRRYLFKFSGDELVRSNDQPDE